MMGQFLVPLLMLVAGCYCAPGTLLGLGGTVGYDSHINGTIGGHLRGDIDGLSINGTGRGIIGASWEPTLIARGSAQVGDSIVAGDTSLKTLIANRWEPGFQGEIGRNSNGTWLLGLQPDSQLYNTFMVSPNVQVKTGDDARRLVGIPVEEKKEIPQLIPVYPTPYTYGYYPRAFNPGMHVPVNMPRAA